MKYESLQKIFGSRHLHPDDVSNLGCWRLASAETPVPVVRLAELDIDPAQLDAYKSALTEEIATAIRIGLGVLKLFAVAVQDHPEQIRLFEMYADATAYKSHLQSPHFLKYEAATGHGEGPEAP